MAKQKSNPAPRRFSTLIWCGLAAVLSFFVGFQTAKRAELVSTSVSSAASDKADTQLILSRNDSNYRWTNRLLDCGYHFDELTPFKHDILSLVEKYVSEKKADEIALVFRHMNNGYGFNINGDVLFTPASLMKTPVLIAAFKNEEEHPGFLAEKVEYTKPPPTVYTQDINGQAPELGKTFTIQDLLVFMTKYSSNEAAKLVIDRTDKKILKQVYDDLKVPLPGTVPVENYLNVIDYARIFRVLYNASYLQQKHSDLALSLLADTVYNDGIVAGVPENVPVSHKFGERVMPDYKQLHDCGVVYFPNDPYLLCIMTRGQDFASMTETIRDVSNRIYNEVSEQFGNLVPREP